MKYLLMGMTEELRNLQREISKTRKHLSNLEARYQKAAIKAQSETEEQRLKRLERELREEYPNLKIRRSLLKLVGTLPYSPVEKDSEDIAEAIAGKYG